MNRLRNWFTRRAERRRVSAPARALSFRPQVESLDERCLPNVSSVLTAVGEYQLIVSQPGTLALIDPRGAISTAYDGQVRVAHAFATPGGGFGADVVFKNGSALHFDPTTGGATTVTSTRFGNPILDMGSAYSAAGQIRVDVLVSNTSSTDLGALGSVVEFGYPAGQIDYDIRGRNDIRWINAYQDANGATGIALGEVSSGYLAIGGGQPGAPPPPDQLVVDKLDTTSRTVLYYGTNDSPAAITDFSQTISPLGSPKRSVVTDITFNSYPTLMGYGPTMGSYALEFTSGAAVNVQYVGGPSISTILPGG
jgi:hypothetical protein